MSEHQFETLSIFDVRIRLRTDALSMRVMWRSFVPPPIRSAQVSCRIWPTSSLSINAERWCQHQSNTTKSHLCRRILRATASGSTRRPSWRS